MSVIPTRCVPTLKDPTSVAVFEAMKETTEDAQANRALIVTIALQGRIQDFEMGGEYYCCNNVREIKYYFNI